VGKSSLDYESRRWLIRRPDGILRIKNGPTLLLHDLRAFISAPQATVSPPTMQERGADQAHQREAEDRSLSRGAVLGATDMQAPLPLAPCHRVREFLAQAR
jgi:hypothetical protein